MPEYFDRRASLYPIEENSRRVLVIDGHSNAAVRRRITRNFGKSVNKYIPRNLYAVRHRGMVEESGIVHDVFVARLEKTVRGRAIIFSCADMGDQDQVAPFVGAKFLFRFIDIDVLSAESSQPGFTVDRGRRAPCYSKANH